MGVKPFARVMRRIALVIILPLLLHACADSGQGSITGYVMKGPVSGSVCTLYRGDNNQRLAGPVTSEEGSISFGRLNYHGVAYVTCQGGTYMDEINGLVSHIPGIEMRAARFVQGPTHFTVTPLTELAVRYAERMGGLSQKNVEKANYEMGDRFGLSKVDIVATIPASILDEQATDTAAGWYGIVLAGLSKVLTKDMDLNAVGEPVYMADELAKLLDGWADMEKDPTTLMTLRNALNSLVLSEDTKDKVAEAAVVKVIAGLGSQPDLIPGQAVSTLSLVSVSPMDLPSYGNVELTLFGTGFGNAIKVFIDGQQLTDVTVDSSHRLTVTTVFATPTPTIDIEAVVQQSGQEAKFVLQRICAYSICESPNVAGCPL